MMCNFSVINKFMSLQMDLFVVADYYLLVRFHILRDPTKEKLLYII